MIIIADKMLTGKDHTIRSNWAIVVQRDRIVRMGPASRLLREYKNHRVMKVAHSVLMPGLVNVHTHLELPHLSLIIHANTYAGWVLSLLRRKQSLRSNDYRQAAQRNIADLIRTGTTTVGEICTHDISPGPLRASGLRAILYREIISMDPRTPRSQLPLVLPRPSATVRFGLSPHSPHTVSLTALASIRDHAATRKLRLCMHVAETREELALLRHEPSSIDRLYQSAGWDPAWAPRARTSVDYLAAHDLLDNRFLAVHAVHVNRHDIALLQRSGAAVAHCPRSNHRLRTGTMPLKAMLDAGIPVGLGTDSLASTESVNLWDEMRFAYQVHRRHGITAGRIMTMAGLGGARALGLDKETGSLERGKKADIIAVPLPPRSGGDLLSDLLMHTKSCTMTLVNGRLLHATAAVTFGAPGAMQTAPART